MPWCKKVKNDRTFNSKSVLPFDRSKIPDAEAKGLSGNKPNINPKATGRRIPPQGEENLTEGDLWGISAVGK